MRARTAVALGLAASLVVIIVLTYAFEPLDDLLVENPYCNGLSTMYREYKPIRVKDLTELGSHVLDPGESTLMIIGPSKAFAPGEVDAVKRYLEIGGRVVLMDDFGTGNQLLEGLGVEARFTGK
ncbi:hypothetical protein GF319_11155, partial [Candidatus Bathyarchaeota archaeon]|nr:hypothetical protein [Candidatus Bathyarchaeota archaeon]